KAERLDGDIKVEIVQALAELYGVDDAHVRVDAQGRKILDERHMMRLAHGLVDQKFDTDPFTLRGNPLAVDDRAPRLLQECARLAQQRAVLAGSTGDRRDERIAEYLVRNLAAEGLEQSHFVGAGLADRHHVGILKQGMEPLIGAVHDGLVGPFEIERADEGLAHPLILERLPPCVEEPTLYPDRPAERD